ncbi:Rv1733c family protein [Streptosporangium sandarakinum]|uniref:Rv1733c family protein n=1 Tax=Streptosporangium TaxID=2000 RepID=UPI0031F7B808
MRCVTRWARCRLNLHRFDGNPLRRGSDRLETVALLVAAVLFVACLWPAMALGRQVYAGGLRAELTGPGHRVPVTAQVVDAPKAPETGPQWRVRTVRWSTAEGAVRTAKVTLPPDTGAGTHTRVWLDTSGRPTSAPQSHVKTVLDTVFAVVTLIGWAAALLLLGVAGLRGLLNRHRAAEWERAWALADQRWRRRRQA